MTDQLNFSLVSPTELVYSGSVEHVVAPGAEGEFGVLPQHAPFMSALKNGIVRILEGGKVTQTIYVHGGFADVTAEGLTILAERAEILNELSAQGVQDKLDKTQDEADIAYLTALKLALPN